jgi:hypothetical protein
VDTRRQADSRDCWVFRGRRSGKEPPDHSPATGPVPLPIDTKAVPLVGPIRELMRPAGMPGNPPLLSRRSDSCLGYCARGVPCHLCPAVPTSNPAPKSLKPDLAVASGSWSGLSYDGSSNRRGRVMAFSCQPASGKRNLPSFAFGLSDAFWPRKAHNALGKAWLSQGMEGGRARPAERSGGRQGGGRQGMIGTGQRRMPRQWG